MDPLYTKKLEAEIHLNVFQQYSDKFRQLLSQSKQQNEMIHI